LYIYINILKNIYKYICINIYLITTACNDQFCLICSTHKFLPILIDLNKFLGLCMYTYSYIYVYIHMYMYIHIFICFYICMHININIYIHTYMYIYTYMYTSKGICFAISPPKNTDSKEVHNICTLTHISSVSEVSDNWVKNRWTSPLNGATCRILSNVCICNWASSSSSITTPKACMHIYIHIYIYICIHIYISIYIYINIYTYINTYIQINTKHKHMRTFRTGTSLFFHILNSKDANAQLSLRSYIFFSICNCLSAPMGQGEVWG
jgi:hypothetical protein